MKRKTIIKLAVLILSINLIATIAIANGGTLVHDWENGTNTPVNSDWSISGGPSFIYGVTCDDTYPDYDVIAGNCSLGLGGVNTNQELVLERDTSVTTTRVGVKMRRLLEAENNDDRRSFRLVDSGGNVLIEVGYQPASDGWKVIHDGGSESTFSNNNISVEEGQSYVVEIKDIDYSANTLDIYVDGIHLGEFTFWQSGSNLKQIRLMVHTTVSDGNANVGYDDVEVGGTSYNFTTPNATIENFEDGDTFQNQTGWKPYHGGTTSLANVQVVNSNEFDGQFYGHVPADGDSEEIRMEPVEGQTLQPNEYGFKFNYTGDLAGGDRLHFRGEMGVQNAFELTVNGSEDMLFNDQFVLASSPNTTYNVELRDMDWSANTVDLVINGTNYGTFDLQAEGIKFFSIRHGDGAGGSDFGINYDSVTTDLAPAVSPSPFNISLDVNGFMNHDSEQTYTVTQEFNNGTTKDITDNATVTSSDTNVITVNQTRNKLISTDNESINQRVTINASFDGQTASENVTVANRTLGNIPIMPPDQYTSTFLAVDDPQADFGIGSEIQWALFAVLLGCMATGITRNEWLGLGVVLLSLTAIWVLGFVNLGLMLAGFSYAVFAGLILLQIPSRSNIRVEVNDRIP